MNKYIIIGIICGIVLASILLFPRSKSGMGKQTHPPAASQEQPAPVPVVDHAK